MYIHQGGNQFFIEQLHVAVGQENLADIIYLCDIFTMLQNRRL